jgi:hypothetical protein
MLGLPRLPFATLTTSKQLVSGLHINNVNALLTGTATGLTATAAGTQVNSLVLNSAFNEVATVTTGNDSVVLPLAKSGLRVMVTNSGAGNSLQIFANGTDVINATAGATGVALAQNATAYFICRKDGTWVRFISA